MFASCKSVIFSSETSVRWRRICFLVYYAAIYSQGSIIALLQYTFLQTFTTDNVFVYGNVLAAVFFATYTWHLCASEFLFEESRRPLVMPFVFFATLSREEICHCISSETIGAILRPQALPFCFHSWSDSVFQFLLCKNQTQRISIRLPTFDFVYITKFSEKIVEELPITEFCVSKDEKPDIDCCFGVESLLRRIQLHVMPCSHDLVP